jgi:hypothetical protein
MKVAHTRHVLTDDLLPSVANLVAGLDLVAGDRCVDLAIGAARVQAHAEVESSAKRIAAVAQRIGDAIALARHAS